MDYKEILRAKAEKLIELISKYGTQIGQEKLNEMNVLINNTFEITDGRLDVLDYDIRDQSIMGYHSRLDSAINSLRSKFEEQDKDTELYK